MKKLLEVRKQIKSRKPKFIRHDIHKNIGLDEKWRKPTGWQNKLRLNRRGKRIMVTPGWGSPKEVEGLSREGLEFVIVNNVEGLKGLSKDKHKVIVASAVGNKKRLAVLTEVKKLGLLVHDFKNIDKKIESINKEVSDSKKKSQDNKKRAEEKAKKSAKKNSKDDKESKDEKKQSEDLKKSSKKEDKN